MSSRADARLLGRAALAACAALTSGSCATILTEQPRAPAPADLTSLEAVVRDDSTDVEAVTWLAVGYVAAGRIEEARALLAGSVARGPHDESVLLMLGLAEEELGRFETAATLHRDYLRTAAGSFRSLAQIHLERLGSALRLAELRQQPSPDELPERVPDRQRIAVLPFVSALLDPPRGFQWLLEEELDAAGFDVVDPRAVQASLAFHEIAPQRTAELAAATSVMTSTGAGVVVQGAMRPDTGDGMDWDLNVVMLAYGGIYEVASIPARGSGDELLGMAARVANAVRLIARDQPVDLDAASPPTAAPATVDALLALARGLRATDRDAWRTAVQEFDRALQLDPDFDSAEEWRDRAETIASAMEVPLPETFEAVARAGQLQRTVAALRAVSSGSFRTLARVGTDRRAPVSEILGLDRLGGSLPLQLLLDAGAGN